MQKGATVRPDHLEPKRPTWVIVMVVAMGALTAMYLLAKPARLDQAHLDQGTLQEAHSAPKTTSEMPRAMAYRGKELPSESKASSPISVSDQVGVHVATASSSTDKPASEIIREQLSVLVEASRDSKPGAFTNPLTGWRRQFVEDVPDATWSPMAEGQAQSYLAHKLGPDVELISVRCGSLVCEVQGASTSPNNSEKAANDWQSNMSAMSGESWWPTFQFATPNSAIWTSADGRALFVSYITRESQPASSQ